MFRLTSCYDLKRPLARCCLPTQSVCVRGQFGLGAGVYGARCEAPSAVEAPIAFEAPRTEAPAAGDAGATAW